MLYTDASDLAYGAVLMQPPEDGEYRPIECMSRVSKPSKIAWAPSTKEFARIVEACNKWKRYLMHRRFRLHTDAQNLCWLFERTEKQYNKRNNLYTRMLLKLKTYDFVAEHISGVQNYIADYMSRFIHWKRVAEVAADELHPDGIEAMEHYSVRQQNLMLNCRSNPSKNWSKTNDLSHWQP